MVLRVHIAASAYTNSYIGTGSTALINYDDSLNIIAKQDPPNAGTQKTIGVTGVNIESLMYSSFDIYKDPIQLADMAFLVLSKSTFSTEFYSINLMTGAAKLEGNITNNLLIKHFTFEIDRTNLSGNTIYALQGTSNLVSFKSENPKYIINTVPITGVTAGQNIVGMDARPKTKEIFIMGYDTTLRKARLYTINPVNGMATAVGDSAISLVLGSRGVGFDFNPMVDKIRVVSSNNHNYRLDPLNGLVEE